MMRKLILTFGLAVALFGGSSARANHEIMEKIALYVPNRIVDALDCFTLNLGVGPVIRAELMATRAVTVGGGCGFGETYKLFKDYNRQYGIGVQTGWYWSLISIGEENMRRDRELGWVNSYWENYAGIPTPTQRIYDPINGSRDYWQFGGALGGLVEGEVYLHPIEGLDFLAGFLFIDFKKDDLTFEDFR